MKRNEVEFVEALRKIGLSKSICESVNGIRKIIFENSNDAGEPLLIDSIVYRNYDDQNGWSDLEFAYTNKDLGKVWADICDMEGRVFANIQDIHQAIKDILRPDNEEYLSFTDNKLDDDLDGVVEIMICFDSDNVVPKDHPNISNAISIGFYYKKTSKTYELTDETMEWKGHTLHRIRALKDFNIWTGIPEPPGVDVKAGDLGGWIESEENLPEYKEPSWVADDAKVFGGAVVVKNSLVRGRAQVYNNAVIRSGAMIEDDAEVYDGAKVYDGAFVGQHARVYGTNGKTPSVFGWETDVGDNSQVFGEAKVHDGARLFGDAKVDYEVSGETIDE